MRRGRRGRRLNISRRSGVFTHRGRSKARKILRNNFGRAAARTHPTTCDKTCETRIRFLVKPSFSDCEAKRFEDERTPQAAPGLRTLHAPAPDERPGARGRLGRVARAGARRRLGGEGAASEV